MRNILALALILIVAGCDMPSTEPKTYTYFPTNSWRVVSLVDEKVVVETTSENLGPHLRVVQAVPVGRLTNGEPARVELTLKRGGLYGVEVVSAKAFPSID